MKFRIVFGFSFCLFVCLSPFAYGQMGNPYVAYGGFGSTEDALNSVNEKIKELNSNKSIPKNELALMRELDEIDKEIQEVRMQIAYSGAYAGSVDRINEIFSRLNAARSEIIKLDCSRNVQNFGGVARRYTSALDELKAYSFRTDFSPLQPPPRLADDLQTCVNAKQGVSGLDFEGQLTDAAAKAKGEMNSAMVEAEKASSAYKQLAVLLNQRRAVLVDALNNGTPQQKITANLPLILLILGSACVLAIVGVKFFDEDIQMEWVASGQVIQFVTVMILLSVITALGLSEILTETTLGTLLGGIAGYVLAQGVGRAAARDVARGLPQSPPPPPPPPPASA